MPKSSLKVFKKRKRVFTGRHIHSQSEVTPRPNEATPEPRSSENSQEPRASTSSKKLSSNLGCYDDYKSTESCFDLIRLEDLQHLLGKVAVCSKCHGPLSVFPTNRLGLSVRINIKCNSCSVSASEKNSAVVGLNKKMSAVNIRLAYAFRCIGKGEEAARNFCGLMNLPSPPDFKRYSDVMLEAIKEVAYDSMKNAVEDCVEQNDGQRDITAIFDGSWQRRGHVSQNGLVTAISETNSKVLDVRILTKYCRCKERLKNEHVASCVANYSGSSGGMESKGILDMFQRSIETYDIRYKNFLGDGDSSAYPTIVEAKPYGPDFNIEKLECVGHIQKRMGSRLRKLKQKMGKEKLEDGKTLGGRGRLTFAAISEIQNYYGLAIRRNVHSLEAMKMAVWAEYFHLGSSNESPAHQMCPKGADSWCKYQRAQASGEDYNHNAHTHYPEMVMLQIKPIFQDLARPELLRRCLHGGTQNACESLNSVIWSRLPKTTFIMKKTLEIGVYEAISTYNEGNIARLHIFSKLGISPGENCVARMKQVDMRRMQKADKSIEEIEKKCRQKRTLLKRKLEDTYEKEEDPDNPSYGAGMH